MLKNKVLEILEQQEESIVTGGELSRRLEVSRTAVWKAINQLKEEGHNIESKKNSGYILTNDNDMLSGEGIRKYLTASTLGNQMKVFPVIPSTNTYLKEQKLSEMPEGYVVVANQQTEGKGRLNRRFYSPSKEGIYVSLLLKPDILATDLNFLTICTALAVCRTIDTLCGIRMEIKWVNDIFYENKKLCGISTEATISAETMSIEHVIVGIGINTGQVSEEVREIATSIYQITGKRVNRNRMIAELLNQLEATYYDLVINQKKAELLEQYTGRQCIINKKVNVINAKEEYVALVLGVHTDGNLLVQKQSGETIRLQSGEVSLRLKENSL